MCRLLFVFLLLPSWLRLYSQDNSFIFSNLNEEDGLSYNVVNCFFKDSRGILWIGTYNGFNRFDGSNFYNYKIRKGSNSLINEVVHSLSEDKKGNIWGSTDDGVFCYIPAEDRFINYEIKSLATPSYCFNMLCDKKGNIWVTRAGSVYKFNPDKNRFDETIKLVTNPDSLRYFRVTKNGLAEDPSGNGLWMTTNSGLIYYNILNHSLTDSRSNAADSLFKNRSTGALCKSPSGHFWFFNNNQREAISFDPSNRKILQRINIGNHMPLASGATLFEDRNKRLWFSSWTYELLVVDLANGNKMSRLSHNPEDNRSIPGEFFWAAYQDDDNTIWLGTVAGIARCNPEQNVYKEYRLHEIIPEIKNTSILKIEEDPIDKSFWIVTQNFLLINYNPSHDKYAVYNLKKAKPGTGGTLPGNSNSILFFNNYIIITTYTGAWQLKRGTVSITPYSFLPRGYEEFKCSEILYSGDSAVYFNNGRELLYWNRVSGKTELIGFPPDASLPQDRTIISALIQGKDKQLWMVSPYDHIAFLDKNRKLTRLNMHTDNTTGSGTITAIDTDSTGNVWLIYKAIGLIRYNPVTKETRIWNETDGLPGNRIQKTIVDSRGRVWNMMYNKISVYIPDADKFYNFKIPFSESNLSYNNHLSKRANGNILGTISNEIVEFFPDRLFVKPVIKKPQISQLVVSGKNLNIFNSDNIHLGTDENTIRFRFGTTTNKDIFPFDLEYKLVGAETNWTIAGESHEALYNNLAPGDYIFRLRVKGKNDTWQSEEAVLNFTIKTPFYKATWFLIITGLLISCLLFVVYRYRLSQKERLMLLENKAQLLEKEKAMVMYENLKQQLNPHFLFNSLTSLNSLIVAEPAAASEFLDSLSKTYRYILKSRDNETVPLIDEIRFAENYVKLQRTRFEKGFEVSIDIPEEYHHRKIVPVTLQNLIENAIKHNIIDEESPLLVKIYVEDGVLVVENNLQRKKFVETSNRQGLANMQSLYKYLSDRPVEIIESAETFKIKLPLL